MLLTEDNGRSYATGLYTNILYKLANQQDNLHKINFIEFNQKRSSIDSKITEKNIDDFIANVISWYEEKHPALLKTTKKTIINAATNYFNNKKVIEESCFNY